MFSSSLLTTDTTAPAQAKTGSAKANSAQLSEDSSTKSEDAGNFAKEFHTASGSEPKVASEQAVTSSSSPASEPKSDDVATEQLATEADSMLAETEADNLKEEIVSDSTEKQQIMNKGEELLNRLSESNKQLSPQEAHLLDGKDLPPQDSESELKLKPLQQVDTVDTASLQDTVDEQAEGLSQEQLAQVFAGPMSKVAVANQDKMVNGANGKSVKTDIEQTDEIDGEAGDEIIASAFALGSVAPPVAAEVKNNTQQVSQQSGDWLQSAGSKAAELNQATMLSAEQAETKGKLESVFAPSALAAATTSASHAALHSESSTQPPASSAINPALTAGMVLPDAVVADGEASAVGTAAGSVAMAAALEATGGFDGDGAEAKSAELTHSLTGLTTSQGQTIAQARAEAAQAAQAQSPLQLSKEQAGDQLAERVQVMLSKNLKHVDIRLDPPELGKLQIKLSLNQDQASVQFTVGNQQTRDLIEQAMPRLRELLNQQGLQLAQGSVQQDNARQQFAGQPHQNAQGQQSESGGQQGRGASRHGDAELGSSEPIDMYVSQSSDRVDYYA